MKVHINKNSNVVANAITIKYNSHVIIAVTLQNYTSLSCTTFHNLCHGIGITKNRELMSTKPTLSYSPSYTYNVEGQPPQEEG